MSLPRVPKGLPQACALPVCLGVALTACFSPTEPPESVPVEDALVRLAEVEQRELEARVAQQIDLEAFASQSVPAAATPAYRMGPGDKIDVTVIGQPDMSRSFMLGPDGCIGLPLGGTVLLQGVTRDEAAELIHEALEPFFTAQLVVGVDITHYENNKVYVLGRVEMPGVVELTGSGTLLQALAVAGGIPVREFRSFLAQCAIIRGRNEILWVDLIDLLQRGNTALNVPLRNGDVVFIPDSEDATVFVMGEVATPGAVPIKVRLNLAQALAQSGGPTVDADLRSVYLIREDAFGELSKPIHVDFQEILDTADFTQNLELRSGDIVYVARSGLGDMDYVLQKVSPALRAITLGLALDD